MSESRRDELGNERVETQVETALDCAERKLAAAKKEQAELERRVAELMLDIARRKEELSRMVEPPQTDETKKSFLSWILGK
jgi:multidrug resistance efflux pump